jgi:hypothetical protein
MFIFEPMVDTTWKMSVHVFVCAMGIDFASNYDFSVVIFRFAQCMVLFLLDSMTKDTTSIFPSSFP